MKLPFQQRDIPIAVVAFFLGVALTLMILKWKNEKEGMTGSTIPGMLNANGSYKLQSILGQIQQYDKRFNSRTVSVRNAPARVMAVKVIAAPSSTKAQIESTGEETKYQRVYSFSTNSWESLKSTPSREGAGYAIEAQSAKIHYTLNNGDRFVLVGW